MTCYFNMQVLNYFVYIMQGKLNSHLFHTNYILHLWHTSRFKYVDVITVGNFI